jgi:hypothetical protein
VSYGIFHKRRRKMMALIPLKARAGIAALAFAAAGGRPSFWPGEVAYNRVYTSYIGSDGGGEAWHVCGAGASYLC